MLKPSSILPRLVAPLLLFGVLPDSTSQTYLTKESKTQQVSTLHAPTYTFVNQGHRQIQTILMGVTYSGTFLELQTNFLKEFCPRNPNAKVILIYDSGSDLNKIKQHLREIKVLNNVQLIKAEGQSYKWVQDPVVFLNYPKKNSVVALSNHNCSFARTLLKANIISDIIVPKNENMFLDGGDYRAVEGPNGPVLIVGLDRRLMGKSRDSENVTTAINEFVNEFSQYGFQPRNILFRGGDLDNITFDQALQKMPTGILTMQEQEIPIGTAIGYHTDLAIFETGRKDERGKPILMMSKPLILYDDYFQKLLISVPEQEKSKLKQSQEWWKAVYEKECRQYVKMGFSTCPLPFGEIYTNNGKDISVVNYTNVVASTAQNGKTEIYLPVQGNNHPLDMEAIRVYRRVYGNSAEIIPITGSQQMSPDGGLLNCLFNVVERR